MTTQGAGADKQSYGMAIIGTEKEYVSIYLRNTGALVVTCSSEDREGVQYTGCTLTRSHAVSLRDTLNKFYKEHKEEDES